MSIRRSQQKILRLSVERGIAMVRKAWVRGYLAAKREKGIVVVCVSWPESPVKRYLIADLNEALEVLTGRKAFTKLKELAR